MTPQEVFAGVGLVITTVAVFMYVIIMGPSRYHRDGKVGKAYRRLIDCPGACCGCFCGIFFGCSYTRGRQKWHRCAEHTIHERNWFMVIFYALLVWSVEFLYLFLALPELETSIFSKLISISLVVASETFYALAVLSNPGIVTTHEEQEAQKGVAGPKGKLKPKQPGTTKERGTKPRHHFLLTHTEEARQNRLYPMDGILYAISGADGAATKPSENGENEEVGMECTTCRVPRPSRSKHCRLCNVCVRRYDHHCPWINNDVAEGTMRWFLLFLLFHAISCSWAAWDLYAIMKAFLIRANAWGWVLRYGSNRVYRLSFLDYLAIIVSHKTLFACLFLFAVMIGFVLWCFWMYEMTFVASNLTVNDMNKIDDAAEFVTSLPSLAAVHREAMNVKNRLERIAAKPPRKLKVLPPVPENAAPGSRADKNYRKKVRQAVHSDLMGLYDCGFWQNAMEVLFPYSWSGPNRERITKKKEK